MNPFNIREAGQTDGGVLTTICVVSQSLQHQGSRSDSITPSNNGKG